MKAPTLSQITGCDESHLIGLPCGHQMQVDAARAYERLCSDATNAGFQLAIASSFRSFERQRVIWNGKASGERPVHDDAGEPLAMHSLSAIEQLHAILRFSALPAASRHHWGTDIDVYDAGAVESSYCVQLSPKEVAAGGVFDMFHCWLDGKISAGESHGFYRPYALDRGGVAPERWHLSYRPVADICARQVSIETLRQCWDSGAGELLLRAEVDAQLPELVARYVTLAE
ncbi:MAG: LAS superfamily LD-carboxypeptidase LdcB [Halioglobus sp.]|jgi:LAS superfamily LD-carboxypeptidase LdcB